MPLRDHSRLGAFNKWETFHSTWAVAIQNRLNEAVLSRRHMAHNSVHIGVRAEIDVAAYEREHSPSLFDSADGHEDGSGGVATLAEPKVYVVPTPEMSEEVSFPETESFEVRISDGMGGWRLVAAIELVSEANKDRPDHRRTFAVKCASYLQTGVNVVVVDPVSNRTANLHAELCDLLDLPPSLHWASPSGLLAVCYRTAQGTAQRGLAIPNGKVRLDMWPHELRIGAALPTVPLWLAADLAVPLELELTYAASCKSLRIE